MNPSSTPRSTVERNCSIMIWFCTSLLLTVGLLHAGEPTAPLRAAYSNVQFLEIDNFKVELSEGLNAAVFGPKVPKPIIPYSPVLEQ